MQALITSAEQRYNSAEGLHRIDTELTRSKGFVPTRIEAAPHLARHAAERSAPLHQHSQLITPSDEDTGEPAGWRVDLLLFAGATLGTAVMAYGLVRLTTGA